MINKLRVRFGPEFRGRRSTEDHGPDQRFDKTDQCVQGARLRRVFSSSRSLRPSVLSAEGRRYGPSGNLRPSCSHVRRAGDRRRLHVGRQSIVGGEIGSRYRLGNSLQSMGRRRRSRVRRSRQRQLLGRLYGNANTFRGAVRRVRLTARVPCVDKMISPDKMDTACRFSMPLSRIVCYISISRYKKDTKSQSNERSREFNYFHAKKEIFYRVNTEVLRRYDSCFIETNFLTL